MALSAASLKYYPECFISSRPCLSVSSSCSSLMIKGNAIAKADYSPYGVDFPLGPSGRFINGQNVADVLAQKLQIPNFIPPFLHPSANGSQIVHGVNYASGGSVIANGLAKQTCLKVFPQLSSIAGVVIGSTGTTSSDEAKTSTAMKSEFSERDHMAYASLLHAIKNSKLIASMESPYTRQNLSDSGWGIRNHKKR